MPDQLESRILLSGLTLSGTAGADVIVFQQTDATHDTFTLNGTPNTFSIAGVTSITIDSLAGSDTVTVLSNNSNIPLTITGSGADTVNVGNAGSVRGILGTLILSGATGQMTLTADDSADATGRTVNVFATAVNGLAPGPIQFTSGQLGSISLKGGSGGNTFQLFSTVVATPVTIDGGTGTNTLVGTNGTIPNDWSITGANSGSVDIRSSGPLNKTTFSSFQNVTGRASQDFFALIPGGSLSGLITGNGGNEILSYANYTAGVTVDLSTTIGTAPNLGGVTGVPNVYGSPFNDKITASPLGSIISGQGGRDTLVGGTGNDTFVINPQNVNMTIDGGGGINTLVSSLHGDTWNITGTNSGTVNEGSFTNIQNLTGGNFPSENIPDNFRFAPGGTISGLINGGAGNAIIYGINSANTWTITGNSSGTYDGIPFQSVHYLNGGTASDSFTYSPAGVVYLITGGGGTDKLIGPNQTNGWEITGFNSGEINSVPGSVNSFTGVQNLFGGTGNDTFKFDTGGSLTGAIVGGGGTDALDYSNRNSGVSVNLPAKTATSVGGAVVNIQNVVGSTGNDQIIAAAGGSVIFGAGGNDTLLGGAGNDTFILANNQGTSTIVNGSGGSNTLIGPNVTNTWNLTGSGSGTLNGATFSGIQNLTGGTASDTFAFGPAGVVPGAVNGDGGVDTLDYSGRSAGVVVNLQTNSATAIGGGVSNMQNVIGTADNDQITAAAGGGVISGDGGNDTLLGSTGNTTFVLASNQGTSTYVNGSSGNATLLGPNVSNSWRISSSNAGTLNGVTFANIRNLTGGSANDTFKFGASGAVSGAVNGGAGTNILDYAGSSFGVIVNLQTNSATGIGGGFANIGSLIGSTGSDTLVGPNTANAWTVSGANSGTINGTLIFSGIENLTGGTANDAFSFASGGSVSALIRGGGGSDTLDYSALTIGVVVDLANGTAAHTGGVSAVQNVIGSTGNDSITSAAGGSVITANGGNDILIGGPGSDTFILSATQGAGTTVDGRGGANTLEAANVVNSWNITTGNTGTLNGVAFGNIQNLTGNSASDTFALGPSGFVAGAVDGGGGANTLDYSGRSAGIAVNLQANSATTVGLGFSNIGSLIGSSGSDLLAGANTANTWNVTGMNSGNVNFVFSFSSIENLTGGFGIDTFVLSNGMGITGTLNGGNSTGDWLDDSASTTAVTVNLTSGVATNTGGVTNIQNVRGGSGGNTLTGNNFGNILIGGSGADAIHGGSGRSVLIGDGGMDTVTGGSSDDIVIGGTTSYDASSAANTAALASILAEWQSVFSYGTRIAHLKGTQPGGLNGTNDLIFGGTVQDDGAVNTLTGGAGMDWFFQGANDIITDHQTGELIN